MTQWPLIADPSIMTEGKTEILGRSRGDMRIVIATLIGAFVLLSGFQPLSAQGAKFVERFADWSTYDAVSEANQKLCFAVSKPKDLEPKNVKRGDIYFYVSSWPKDGVANEVSVKIGYDFAKDSTSKVSIGSDVFELFTDGDKAFVESPAQERRLVAAMRRGSKMLVRGRSVRGTSTTDVYSLSGITAALKNLEQICR